MSEQKSERRSQQETEASRHSFAPAEPLAEKLLHMLVATAAELAVTRGRLDTLERYLSEAGTLPEGGLDSDAVNEALPPGSIQEAAWREQFLDRFFSDLQREIESVRQSTTRES